MHGLLTRRARAAYRPLAQRALIHASASLCAKSLQRFKLADIGEGITECEVIRWNVQPNALVQAFDQLCEVQSDKASVEITSPFDGVVKELLVPEGKVAKVGEALCTIEVDDEAADSVDSTLVEPIKEAAVQTTEPQISERSQDAAQEVPVPPSREDVAAESAELSRAVGPPVTERRPHPLDPNQPPPSQSSGATDVLANPAVRHFARCSGVDLSQVAPGSGKDGRIEKKDVEAFLTRSTIAPKPSASASTPSATAASNPASVGEDVIIDLGRTRYGMWKAMEKSLAIPHFGYSTSLDLTRLHDLLPLLNAHIPQHYLLPSSDGRSHRPPLVNPAALYPAPTPPDVPDYARFNKLTYLPFLLKTLAKAMHAWPLFRSSIAPCTTPDGKPRLAVRPQADIALALSTPTGLYTPVLRGVGSHSVYSLASRVHDLAYRGRQTPSTLTPADMPRVGGTVSVSNIGPVCAGEGAAPVLVPGGGVAIVALGRARWVLEVDGPVGEPVRRLRLPVSWAADHRVVEGAELGAFVEEWRRWAEHPERLVGEGI